METVTVRIKHEKAKRLLQDLEDLDLIEMVEDSYLIKRPQAATKISDLPNVMQGPLENNEKIDKQLDQLRNEWERNF